MATPTDISRSPTSTTSRSRSPGAAEPEGDSVSLVVSQGESLDESSTVEAGGARQVADADDAPPLGPEPSGTEPSSDAASPSSGAERREPPPLDLTEPGTEDHDFRRAYGSLHDRNQFYRQEMNLRGNFFMREYLADIDARAFELFTEVGGSADEVAIDNFGYRTTSVYDNLEVMAEEAELAGRMDEAADIRAAMDEIEGMVNASAIDAAGRTDEFSGVAIGSQRGAIDPNIDVDKLRSWLLEQELKAEEDFGRLMAEGNAEAAQAAGWERAYYNQLIVSLDAGVNPLAYSNEEIAVLRLNKVEPYYAEYYAQFADEIAAAAAEGYEYVIPRPSAEDEMDLYIRLQELLVATLSDPEFFLSAEDVGLDAYSFAVRARIEAGAEFLGPDSLRPFVDFDIPQSLPEATPPAVSATWTPCVIGASPEARSPRARRRSNARRSPSRKATQGVPRRPRSGAAARPSTTPGRRSSTIARAVGSRTRTAPRPHEPTR